MSLDKITIIKRDNRTTPFQGEKIALAIKKGFDSIQETDYDQTDVFKVYHSVLAQLPNYVNPANQLRIEDIQDVIERELWQLGYRDVYESFSSYRNRRNESRRIFISKQHKFLKAIEELYAKDTLTQNENTQMGRMLLFGTTIARDYAKAYLLTSEQSEAHDAGAIAIHDIEYLPMGSTATSQIALDPLFAKGFRVKNSFLRAPQSITSYGALSAIVLQSNQNDQSSSQAIAHFDADLAPGVLLTFKQELKELIHSFHFIQREITPADQERISREIDRLTSIDYDGTRLDTLSRKEPKLSSLLKTIYEQAYQRCEEKTHQAMEAFVHNLNTIATKAGAELPDTTISLGLDTTSQGRMITHALLHAFLEGVGNGGCPRYPEVIFIVKKGVNSNPDDPNYDLFELACHVSSIRNFPFYNFADASFNHHQSSSFSASYSAGNFRLYHDQTTGRAMERMRGVLSTTSINLVRIAIKHGIALNQSLDLKSFYQELDQQLDLVKAQLLDRYQLQLSQKSESFPFLLGQGVWAEAKNLKRSLRHGTLNIGFLGLAQALIALCGDHHGRRSQAQQLGLDIVNHMNQRIQSYSEQEKLNFVLYACNDPKIARSFINIDKAIYGSLPEITDREAYSFSFMLPDDLSISDEQRIEIEAPYHALTLGGHLCLIKTAKPMTALEIKTLILTMQKMDIGCGGIITTLQMDYDCGYVGFIDEFCPGCGRPCSDRKNIHIITENDYL